MLLVAPLAFQPPVGANASSCQGSYQERHRGWLQGGQKWGSGATIGIGSLAICTNPTSFTIAGSFAWTNIEGGNGGSSIVQIGVGRCRKPLSAECDGNRKVL